MLVQVRDTGLRLVRQHDHALLAGRLAAAWSAPPAGPVPWPTVVAVSLHDVVWHREDRLPRLDPGTGRPHDFTSLPADRKAGLVAQGLARLRAVSPALARPVAAHHHALADGVPPGPDAELTRIRFFDILSLRLCLTAPGSERPPVWLRAAGEVAPDGYSLPELRWSGPGEAVLEPFPLSGPLEVGVPCRDLPPGPYRDQRALGAAWREAPESRWTVRLRPSASRSGSAPG